MTAIQDIENHVLTLTIRMEVNYPELYISLNENPITIPSKAHPNMDLSIMKAYLDSLKQILKQYIKTHSKA